MVRPLTKKHSVRTLLDSQYIKGVQTLVKSSWEHFHHIFSSLWGEIILKIFPWFKFEIIGVSAHGLAITSILFRIVGISRSLLKCNYLESKKYFLCFLFHLKNIHQISNISKKKKIVIANVFPKLTTVQDLVRPLTKKRRVRTSFDSQHVRVSQTLVKSSWEHFYHLFPSLWEEMTWKISPRLKFEIIRVFVNTWSADYNYPVPDSENLPLLLQMQLS